MAETTEDSGCCGSLMGLLHESMSNLTSNDGLIGSISSVQKFIVNDACALDSTRRGLVRYVALSV